MARFIVGHHDNAETKPLVRDATRPWLVWDTAKNPPRGRIRERYETRAQAQRRVRSFNKLNEPR